jgi:RNA-directed DNA polymerase
MKWESILEKRDSHAANIRRLICTSNGVIPSFSHSLREGRVLTFLSVSNWIELSCFLQLSPIKLEQVINCPNYRQFTIPKKKGAPRLIFQPDPDLMKIQRKLNRYLQDVYSFQLPECVHGFVCKSNQVSRSIVTNAQPHVNKQRVLSIDLENYFPSISAKRIKVLFCSWGFNEEIATALTLLCTFKGGLPAGAPSSPVLANLCTMELDSKLIDFSKNNELTYTRYADDLTFSSNDYILDDTILRILEIIKWTDFSINMKKNRCMGRNSKQKITGIVVNEKLTADRKVKKKLRAMLNDLAKNGLEIATQRHYSIEGQPTDLEQNRFLKHVIGVQSFVNMVNNHRFS